MKKCIKADINISALPDNYTVFDFKTTLSESIFSIVDGDTKTWNKLTDSVQKIANDLNDLWNKLWGAEQNKLTDSDVDYMPQVTNYVNQFKGICNECINTYDGIYKYIKQFENIYNDESLAYAVDVDEVNDSELEEAVKIIDESTHNISYILGSKKMLEAYVKKVQQNYDKLQNVPLYSETELTNGVEDEDIVAANSQNSIILNEIIADMEQLASTPSGYGEQ